MEPSYSHQPRGFPGGVQTKQSHQPQPCRHYGLPLGRECQLQCVTGHTEAQELQRIAVSGVLHLCQIHRREINHRRRRITSGTQHWLDFLNPRLDRARSTFDARHNLVLTTTYPFPFRFQQKVVSAILGGWGVNGIGIFRTGEPFTLRYGSNRSANGDRWSPDRPILNSGFRNDPTSGTSPGCHLEGVAGYVAGPDSTGKYTVAPGTPLGVSGAPGTQGLYYDPCAFSRPLPGTYGNLGRNTLTGPGFFNLDF